MPNALAHESSPYLLQHQNNPVAWHPWGAEAIDQARRENKPIFLSIGYSACHWCHVMEHESFENDEIARYLNEHFISIKVDREERPDLDQIYMNAVQLLTGRGGWPMSVFLTPDLKPFFGGTYWPPTPRMGMPGFQQVLAAVVDAWQNRRDQAIRQADELTSYLQDIEQGKSPEAETRESAVVETGASAAADDPYREAGRILDNAARQLGRAFDPRHGGFGSAPKFPHSMDLQLLTRLWRREARPELLEMIMRTLDKMAAGGIYDHLAGGFARYSVDERWLVPHFEKMLYDNALLTSAYLDAYLATGEERFARIADATCGYVLTYLTDAHGGFYSTEDADSEGEEGKFYVWTPDQIKQVLGEEAGERFCYVYDVSPQGNFEHGTSILNLPKTIDQCAALRGWNAEELKKQLAASRILLLAARDRRVRPGKDDKVLVSWNGLMIDALARAAHIVNQPEYLIAAEKAASFLLHALRRPDGRLLHTWRHGRAKLDAYLDDYACLMNALVTLYEATFNERWIDEAVGLADSLLMHFADRQQGGFFFTADDHEQLIARNKDLHDASVPSGNAITTTALLRLGRLCGRSDYLDAAARTLAAALPVMERSPTAAGQMLIALDMGRGPARELVVVGGRDEAANQQIIAALQTTYLPQCVFAYRGGAADASEAATRSPILAGLFAGRSSSDSEPALYICENFACRQPSIGKEAILAAIEAQSKR